MPAAGRNAAGICAALSSGDGARSPPAASGLFRMADYLTVSVPSASVVPSLVNVNL